MSAPKNQNIEKIPGAALINVRGIHCTDRFRKNSKEIRTQIDPFQIYGEVKNWDKNKWNDTGWDSFPPRYLLKCAEKEQSKLNKYKNLWEKKFKGYYSVLNQGKISIEIENNTIKVKPSTQLNLNDPKNKETIKLLKEHIGVQENAFDSIRSYFLTIIDTDENNRDEQKDKIKMTIKQAYFNLLVDLIRLFPISDEENDEIRTSNIKNKQHCSEFIDTLLKINLRYIIDEINSIIKNTGGLKNENNKKAIVDRFIDSITDDSLKEELSGKREILYNLIKSDFNPDNNNNNDGKPKEPKRVPFDVLILLINTIVITDHNLTQILENNKFDIQQIVAVVHKRIETLLTFTELEINGFIGKEETSLRVKILLEQILRLKTSADGSALIEYNQNRQPGYNENEIVENYCKYLLYEHIFLEFNKIINWVTKRSETTTSLGSPKYFSFFFKVEALAGRYGIQDIPKFVDVLRDLYIICPLEMSIPPKKPYIRWARYDRTFSYCAGNISGTTPNSVSAKRSSTNQENTNDQKRIKEMAEFLEGLISKESESNESGKKTTAKPRRLIQNEDTPEEKIQTIISFLNGLCGENNKEKRNNLSEFLKAFWDKKNGLIKPPVFMQIWRVFTMSQDSLF